MAARSILIVDDDWSAREMLGLALRKAGFYARTASGGAEALELLRTSPFDWLLTDAHMKPMDGFELTRRAKALRPELRVAMISAVQSVPAPPPTEAIETFFPKPVIVEDVARALAA
ncbi:MAG: response regulator [Elusimicrobia bacterium]|nr:response regulator [Elusimicrobiota bacterium]MDE2236439.1 response regulator [Elusimicrobiota bacterium]MDE2425170.1 response regulator [Elusimicrobiota bacterium]